MRIRHFTLASLAIASTLGLHAAQISVTPVRPPAGSGAPQPAPSVGTGLITGRVIDADTEAPVPAAIVTLTGGPYREISGPPRVLTDEMGRFFFDRLPPASYTVTTTKPGWIAGASGRTRPAGTTQPIEIRDGGPRADVTLRTWRYAVISGQVTDEAAEPLISAEVRVFQETFAAGHRRFTFVTRAITDDRGAFRVSSLLPGRYVAVVPASVTSEPPAMRGQAGSQPYLQTMTALGAAPMLLESAGVLAGGVQATLTPALDLSGAPSANAPWRTYTTTFAPSVTSLQAARVITTVPGHEQPGVDIVVKFVPTARVSGVLTEPDGKPAALHAIHLLPAEDADYPVFDVATAITDGAGAYTFFGVPAGNYLARVVRVPVASGIELNRCGGTGAITFVCATATRGGGGALPPVPIDPLLFGERAITVADRDLSDVTIQMRAGARVTGRIEFDGTASRPTDAQLAAVQVLLEPAGGQSAQPAGGFDITPAGRIDPDGRFATPSSLPGSYYLRVTSAPPGWTFRSAIFQGRDVSESAFDLRTDVSDLVITFTDRPTTIAGAVQDPDSLGGRGATVMLFPADPAGWLDYGLSSRRVRSVAVAGAQFTLPAPPAGDYYLMAVPDELSGDWPSPAFLRRLASVADRINVANGVSLTHPLRIRRIP